MLRLLLMRLLVTFQEDKRYRFCTRKDRYSGRKRKLCGNIFKRWLISYGTSENFEKTKLGRKRSVWNDYRIILIIYLICDLHPGIQKADQPAYLKN